LVREKKNLLRIIICISTMITLLSMVSCFGRKLSGTYYRYSYIFDSSGSYAQYTFNNSEVICEFGKLDGNRKTVSYNKVGTYKVNGNKIEIAYRYGIQDGARIEIEDNNQLNTETLWLDSKSRIYDFCILPEGDINSLKKNKKVDIDLYYYTTFKSSSPYYTLTKEGFWISNLDGSSGTYSVKSSTLFLEQGNKVILSFEIVDDVLLYEKGALTSLN